MARIERVICDRCRKEITDNHRAVTVKFGKDIAGDDMGSLEIDLCDYCFGYVVDKIRVSIEEAKIKEDQSDGKS